MSFENPTPGNIHNPEKKLPEGFRVFLVTAIGSLNALKEKLHKKELHTYGSLVEKNSSNRAFTVENIWWQGDAPFINGRKNVERTMLLVGIDVLTKKIAGLRQLNLTKTNTGKYEVEGEIQTGIRGIGAATAIDKGLIEILQKLSNELEQEVSWKVTNAHLYNIENFKTKWDPYMTGKKLEEYKENLLRKEEEQKRWQSLYGDEGTFGLTLNSGSLRVYSRKFIPENTENISCYNNVITDEKYEEIATLLEKTLRDDSR